jgi:hypothetical protein
MPLRIGEVQTRIDIVSEQQTAESAASPLGVRLQMSDSELKEKMRPILMDLLEEELARFRRWQG